MTGAGNRACVVGWPIAHSRSPLLHGYWLAKYGIDGSYTKLAVPPGGVAAFFSTLRQQGFAGCNVTLPHKEAAYAAAADRRAEARAVGAANTLWFEAGRLVADNTDGAAFMAHLAASAPAFDPRQAIVCVLGAGGAARAIIHAFLAAGAGEVRVFNRTLDRAEAVARYFGAKVRPYAWRERGEWARDVDVLVNATSLGMVGADPLDLDLSGFDSACIVADIVYVPLETPLLRAAKARGMMAVDGLGMFLHQAVPGFEKWFGVRPQVTAELRALVVADIEGR